MKAGVKRISLSAAVLIAWMLLFAGAAYAEDTGSQDACEELQSARYQIDELFRFKDLKGVIAAGKMALDKKNIGLCDKDVIATLYESVGDAYGGLGDYSSARVNYIKALEPTNGLDASDGMDVVMRLYGRLHILSQMVTVSLRGGDSDGGIKYALEFLMIHDDVKSFFSAQFGSDYAAPDFLAYSYYNIACAFALKSDRENALRCLEVSLKANPKFKENMKKDTDLKLLWKDKRFKALINK